MFDARSLLESLVRGAAPQPQQPQGGGLADILGKMLQGGGGQQGAPQTGGAAGLEDLLRKMMPGGGMPGGGQAQQQGAPGGGGLADILGKMLPGGGMPSGGQQQGAPGGGGLADILGKLGQQQGGGAGGQPGGGLMDILGQVLGQATSGVKDGARRIDDATGIGRGAREAVGQATGQSPEELMAKLKELIAQNQMGAAAAGAGAGAVILGTQTGRSIAASALKIGGLALIGGLAYKALQNYQQGKPLLTGASNMQLTEAPRGSGFEAQAVTNESASLYIRGMIAAAAADGRLDAKEQARITGGLKQAGLDHGAEEFLAQELNNPASVQDLAGQVTSEQEAVQLFTAARIAVDLDTQEEHDFLVTLAQGLGLERDLVAHIDAAARAQQG